MNAWNASAVVAKPPGTETPSWLRLPIISPSEEFLPPTWARSFSRRSCSQRMLALKARLRDLWKQRGKGRCAETAGRCPAETAILATPPSSGPFMPQDQSDLPIRPVFYVSDGTRITAETMGHSL